MADKILLKKDIESIESIAKSFTDEKKGYELIIAHCKSQLFKDDGVRLYLRFSNEEADMLDKFSKNSDVTESGYIKSCIRKFLESEMYYSCEVKDMMDNYGKDRNVRKAITFNSKELYLYNMLCEEAERFHISVASMVRYILKVTKL